MRMHAYAQHVNIFKNERASESGAKREYFLYSDNQYWLTELSQMEIVILSFIHSFIHFTYEWMVLLVDDKIPFVHQRSLEFIGFMEPFSIRWLDIR